MRALRAFPLALFALLFTSIAHADDKANQQARLDRVNASTRLDDPALKPWYMKVNFQLYDTVGKPVEQGTLEEWWAGPSLYKTTVTSPSYTATQIVNKQGKFRTIGAVEMPFFLDMLEQQLIHPVLSAAEMPGFTPELVKTPAGAPECIMYSRNVRGIPFPTIGLFPTYCMVPGKDILVASYDSGIFTVERSAMGGFQGKVVSVDLKVTYNPPAQIQINHFTAITSHMVAIKLAELNEADLVISAHMEAVNDVREKVAYSKLKPTESGVINPVAPNTINPSKFGDAGQVQVLYGTDGHVRWMRLFSAPDPVLAASAMAAALNWTIKPYMINERRVQVETVVETPFSKSSTHTEGTGIR